MTKALVSRYTIQIIEKRTKDVVAQFEPGDELVFFGKVIDHASEKYGIGLLRTVAAVKNALTQSFYEVLLALKSQA